MLSKGKVEKIDHKIKDTKKSRKFNLNDSERQEYEYLLERKQFEKAEEFLDRIEANRELKND